MGPIVDSSVLITAERRGQNARQMLSAISTKVGDTEIAISVVTLIELAHGAARADNPQRRASRQQFIQELLTALPIHPVTVSVALRTGQIDGESQGKGVRLPLSDLLIGVRPHWIWITVSLPAIFVTSSWYPVCPWCPSSRRDHCENWSTTRLGGQCKSAQCACELRP